MTVQEFCSSCIEFLNLCAVYYVIQILKCVQISFIVCAFVFFLRKTLLKNRVFLKGIVWSLFIPVLFAGRLKFYYENDAGVLLFSWWTETCKIHIWINWLYLCGVSIYAARLILERRKLRKWIAGLEKRRAGGTAVYAAKIPVTPSVTGIFRPKIVMPEIILKEYDEKEIQTILLHEKTHIRLGHLLFYFLWDILRVLLWLNPLLTAGTKYFREDMEEICDFVTIRQCKGNAYEYGQLIIKSIRVLQAESENLYMPVSFAGDKQYQNIRQRMSRIVSYRPYKRMQTAGMLFAAALCIAALVIWIQDNSYGRYNESDVILVYGYDGNEVTFFDNSDVLHQMISYDDHYVYVDREVFEKHLYEKNTAGDIYIVFGGFYKLPGVGGLGYSCCYEPVSKEQTAKIPYESPISDWRVKLLKML